MHDYYVYSIRTQSWVSPSGGTSDITRARVFSRNAAFTFCAAQRTHDAEFGAIPVRADDIAQLSKESPFR